MNDRQPSIADEVERYLRTGETDPHYAAWPGNGFMERANRAHEDLRGALVRDVRRLAEGLAHDPLPQVDTVALTRDKVEPVVRGLFPRVEQDQVLATLEKSVVFLTSMNIEPGKAGKVSEDSSRTRSAPSPSTSERRVAFRERSSHVSSVARSVVGEAPHREPSWQRVTA